MKIVLLHAFPLDEEMWAGQRDALAGFDVEAPNLYRLGGSSIDGWADAILRGLEDEFVAVGASMGGYVALSLARRVPEQVRGLMLVGSRSGPDSAERRQFRTKLIRQLRMDGIPPDMETKAPAEDLARASEALRDRSDASDVVAAFTGPFVLVVGAEDELLALDEARAIVEAAPRGRLEVVADAGHLVNLDQPERFNAILREFLQPWR